jgi:hypothetical protein
MPACARTNYTAKQCVPPASSLKHRISILQNQSKKEVGKLSLRFDVTSVYPIVDGRRYHYRHVWLPHTRNIGALVKWAWWIIVCYFYNVVPAE